MVGLAERLVDLKRTVVPAEFRGDRYANYETRLGEFGPRLSTINEVCFVGDGLGIDREHLVLDVGCGDGLAGQLMHRRYGCEVRGLEIQPSLAARARARGVTAWLYDGRGAMPFKSESFDVVTCFHTLAHVADPFATMLEMRRILKPGGRLGIVTPNRWYTLAMLPKNLVNDYRPDLSVLRYYGPRSLGVLMRDVGYARAWTYCIGEKPWPIAPRWMSHRVVGVAVKG